MMDLGLGYVPDEKDERDFTWRAAIAPSAIELPASFRRRAVGPVLNQGTRPHCFPEGTLIRLKDGTTKKIEDIKTRDYVVTAEGNIGMVEATMVRFYEGDLVKVGLWGHSHLKCTPEHPILTERGYVPAQDLRPDDFVALPKHFDESVEEIYPSDFVTLEKRNVNKKKTRRYSGFGAKIVVKETTLPSVLKLDYKLGRLFGLYAAEGCCRAKGYETQWSFNSTETDLIDEVKSTLEEVFGADVRIQTRPSNVTNVIVFGRDFSKFFSSAVPGDCYSKCVSGALLSGPRPFLRGLLDGWTDGDGHVRRSKKTGKLNRMQAVTVSKSLAMDMYGLAQGLGLAPTITRSKPSMNRHAKTRATRWDVYWPLSEVKDEAKWKWRSKHTEKATFRKVRSLEFEPFAGYVHNFQVEGDNSYVAEGVGVHNCVAFSTKSLKYFQEYRQHRRYYGFDTSWLYKKCKQVDGIPNVDGTYIRVALQIMQDRGYLAKAERYKLAVDSYFKIKYYVRLTSLRQIKEAVYTKGPVVFGIMVDSGIYKPNSYGIVPQPNGDKEGGHAMLIVGWDNAKNCGKSRGAFLVKNSWGTNYGLNGYMWLPYTHFKAYPDWDAWKVVDRKEIIENFRIVKEL